MSPRLAPAHRTIAPIVLVLLFAPPLASAADPHMTHLDWQEGTTPVGLLGLGPGTVDQQRFDLEVGPCHRDLRLDLMYAPDAVGGPSEDTGVWVAYTWTVTLQAPNGTVVREAEVTDARLGIPLARVPAAGTYTLTLRLDVGAVVDWSVRVRGVASYGEPTCDLFLNEVEQNPSGSDAGHEWVEVYNRGDTDHALDNWQVWGESWRAFVDATPFVMPPGTVVPAGGHIQVMLTGAEFLDDINETVVLADPSGRLVDHSVLLDDRTDDARSHARNTDGDAAWNFGPASPGTPN